MFDFVRKHTRILQFVLFLLIFPSFVLFGVEGYQRMNDRGDTVASVDGTAIHQSEWDAAHKREVDQLRQQMPQVDAKLLDSAEARYATLERLVRERVIAVAAQKAHLTASDEALARELQANPVIASLRGPDGKLDGQRYRQLLAQQGLTPEAYENGVRAELSLRQVLGGIAASGIAPQGSSALAMGAWFERRELQAARFDAAAHAAKVMPTDAEVEAFYKANPQRFQAPEQADIEYLVLDLASIRKDVAVNEADLRAYFEQNQAQSAGKEERRASHILIAAPKDAPAATREAAKKKAQELLAQVRANPQRFAEIARENSQDPGSAAKGGDLDFFARGAMVKPFEDAAFALKKGDTSEVVESDFGFHIIRLTDIKAPKRKTFEEARPELETQLKAQQAQRKFAETADAFSNAVYEQSDSLKGVAERFKLELRTAAGVTREGGAGLPPQLANPKFLNAVFGPDAIEKKRNTEAVEVAPGAMVSGRIVKYQPARTRPLDEVKAQAVEQVKAERGRALAREAGEAQLAAWKAEPAKAQLAAPVVVSRTDPKGQPRAVVEAALKADPAALPAWIGVDLGDAGYAVVRVARSIPREQPDAATAARERQEVAQALSQAETLAYLDLLKQRFKAEIKVARPAATQAEAPR